MCADIVGPARLGAAHAFSLMMSGMFTLLVPSLAGVLGDMFDSWRPAYALLTALSLAAASLASYDHYHCHCHYMCSSRHHATSRA